MGLDGMKGKEDTVIYNLFFFLFFCTGEKEGWWLGHAEEVFSSILTAATSSVLRSELDSCQELLQLEPENKCESAGSSWKLLV